MSSHYRPPQPSPGPRPLDPPAAPMPGGYGAGRPPVAHPPRAAYGAAVPRPQSRQVLMAGGSMLALAALVITPKLGQSQEQAVEPFTCIKQEQTQALLSRDQLKQLLETDLQAPRATVKEFLRQPYCVLSPGKTEAGQPAEREAYPLEFDPQTWLVVLYEGDRYAGYDFRFR
ncbi:MAG TPA: hypothetical protein VLS96_06355 [Nodosilinea sp.]|nr:hypothetical protein [Nodosilinea sp.]